MFKQSAVCVKAAMKSTRAVAPITRKEVKQMPDEKTKLGASGKGHQTFSEALKAAEERAGGSFTPLPRPDIHKTLHPEKLDI